MTAALATGGQAVRAAPAAKPAGRRVASRAAKAKGKSSQTEGTPPGVRVEGLALQFGSTVIFENLNLELQGGEFVVLLGASGVGKSSLLKIIAGLSKPSKGQVVATDGLPLHHRIAYMGQQDLLYPWLNVVQNVMLGSRLRGEKGDESRALDLLGRVGLAERAKAQPSELSGGMRQRAAIARTLYEDRPFVLMDEPFSALDSITRAKVQDLAAELLQGRTTLLITHDPLEACRLADRLMVLSGHPAQLGAPIAISGPTPRAPDNDELLHTQGRLMRALTEMEPE